jgi:hypothetical protein
VPREFAVRVVRVRLLRRHLSRARQEELRSEEVLRTLSGQSITFTSLVPTQYIMLLGLPKR